MLVQQTKGTFKLTGKTNIEKVETKDFGWLQKTNMTVKTLKDNFVSTGFEVKNGRGLDVKIKVKGDEGSRKVSSSSAVQELKDTFTNEDMVFVMGVADYDTYRKEFLLKPIGVYHSESSYDAEDFKETNFVEHEFVFNEFNGKVAKLYIATYFGEMIEVEMKVSDELKEDFEGFKTGDLIKAVFSVINKPNYVDAEESASSGYKPKGKGVSGNGKGKRTIDGYTTYNIVVGIADVVSGKYSRKDIRETQEEFERKQSEYQTKKADSKPTSEETIEEDDLPY